MKSRVVPNKKMERFMENDVCMLSMIAMAASVAIGLPRESAELLAAIREM